MKATTIFLPFYDPINAQWIADLQDGKTASFDTIEEAHAATYEAAGWEQPTTKLTTRYDKK